MPRKKKARKREESVINDLTEEQGIVLATGGGSVMSKENRNRLSARGIAVYLETTIEKQLARTTRRQETPSTSTDNPRDVPGRFSRISQRTIRRSGGLHSSYWRPKCKSGSQPDRSNAEER